MTQLRGKDVGPIGLGLMGFTWRAKPCSQEQAIEAMHTALKHGNNLWNGAEFYGTPEYNSPVLVERYLQRYPEDADKIVLIINKVQDIPKNSVLRHFPRFQPDNLDINLQLVQQVEKMAQKKGCTATQLAINWTRMIANRPGMPTIIPTPGATTVERIEENAKLIDLTEEEMAEIDATLAKFTTAGDRYPSIFPSDT
ncbi:hypothetical protein MY10362_009555 [Beauveria mimosiformis]